MDRTGIRSEPCEVLELEPSTTATFAIITPISLSIWCSTLCDDFMDRITSTYRFNRRPGSILDFKAEPDGDSRIGGTSSDIRRDVPRRQGKNLFTKGFNGIRDTQIKPEDTSTTAQSSNDTTDQVGSSWITEDGGILYAVSVSRAIKHAQGLHAS